MARVHMKSPAVKKCLNCGQPLRVQDMIVFGNKYCGRCLTRHDMYGDILG